MEVLHKCSIHQQLIYPTDLQICSQQLAYPCCFLSIKWEPAYLGQPLDLVQICANLVHNAW